ncbi:centrosomal protein of 112 kDa [Pholidichthys leucotaenia]
MNKYEHSLDRLDTEFDHFLLDMKPYVLKHLQKSERQRCALWIKKLCDPASCGSGLMGRKNRNIYARLLLHMLKRGVLEGPFSSKPELGILKTLPAYMSIYFDEPLSGPSAEYSNRDLPDWVTGELGGTSDDSLGMDLLKDRPSSTPIKDHQRRKLYEEQMSSQPLSSSPVKQSPRQATRMEDVQLKHASPDDSDLEACLNSWNLGIENPRYLREKPIPLSPIFKSSFGGNSTFANDQGPQVMQSKEIEMKIKVLEAKHQEEKLILQQKHDADVEKILDRKNGEIEEIKSLYRTKQKESEEIIRKLEKKVQSVLRESQVICESKEKQIVELKKMSDQSTDSLKNEWEKKLHAAVAEMEQEKFELQKKHTENIQELLEDTNVRLAKMESDYNTRYQATVLALQSEVEKEKAEAKRKIAKLEEALREMESQLDRARESQRLQIQQADMVLEQFKKQVELSSEKVYADMKLQMEKVEEDLIRSKTLRENQAKEFSQQLDALRQKYEQQMAEQRMQHEQERMRLQQQHNAERDSLVQERQREVSSLERQARAALQQHQQHTQEWRKRDAQTVSDLEAELSSLREELRQAHAQHKQQLAEMALVQEEEKQKAILDKEASLVRLRSDMEQIHSNLERGHQQEKDVIHEKTNSRMKQIEKEYSQKLAKSAQLIAELQTSVLDSKEEAVRLQQAMEKRLKEANTHWNEERKSITNHADQANKALQEKVESLQKQLYCAEKNLLSKELETEEKVTMVHQEYEEKIKGLMPAELRQELEDTITSLKAQVTFLQKRASLLQEDLDACRSRR